MILLWFISKASINQNNNKYHKAIYLMILTIHELYVAMLIA